MVSDKSLRAAKRKLLYFASSLMAEKFRIVTPFSDKASFARLTKIFRLFHLSFTIVRRKWPFNVFVKRIILCYVQHRAMIRRFSAASTLPAGGVRPCARLHARVPSRESLLSLLEPKVRTS